MPAIEQQGAERPDELEGQGSITEDINDIKNRLAMLEDQVKQILLRGHNVHAQVRLCLKLEVI